MLAEIFIVKLEAAARVSREATTPGKPWFVPFVGGGRFLFKDGRKRFVEFAREEGSPSVLRLRP
jgi:hypothetical protein